MKAQVAAAGCRRPAYLTRTLGAPAIISNGNAIKAKADLDGFKMLAVGKDKIQTWKNLGAVPNGFVAPSVTPLDKNSNGF